MTTYARLIEKGKIEGKIEVVLNCFNQNMAIPLIANITDLKEDDVLKILRAHSKIK